MAFEKGRVEYSGSRRGSWTTSPKRERKIASNKVRRLRDDGQAIAESEEMNDEELRKFVVELFGKAELQQVLKRIGSLSDDELAAELYATLGEVVAEGEVTEIMKKIEMLAARLEE